MRQYHNLTKDEMMELVNSWMTDTINYSLTIVSEGQLALAPTMIYEEDAEMTIEE